MIGWNERETDGLGLHNDLLKLMIVHLFILLIHTVSRFIGLITVEMLIEVPSDTDTLNSSCCFNNFSSKNVGLCTLACFHLKTFICVCKMSCTGVKCSEVYRQIKASNAVC